MTCTKCGEKPEKSCGAFPKAVIEIDNPEKIVLLRKVLVPASMGDESTFPPTIGKYHNVLLEYEASGGIYLYSSDGIPTKLSSDVTELQAQLNALRVRIGEEEVARADADTALSNRITSLDNSLATVAKTGSYNDLSDKPTIGNGTLTIKKNGSNVGTFTANATANTDVNIVVPTKTSDLANDGSDGTSQYVESDDLSTVATSGSYNDLTNKPTIGNATLTIKRNDTNVGTFTANATTNKSINITVPTKTSDLTNDGADGTSTYVEADDLPTVDTAYSSSSNNAIANSTVTNSLDRNVMTNLAVDSTPSTTTVNLSNTKTNLAYPSSSTTSSISLPVASSTQAGVMNSATFDAVTSNTNNINAILNGAVAISNLPASPTQAQLTTAWENETGLTSLINRASVYDVTNNKVWTYYTNDQTWHAASNTSQVTVNTFTNSSEGTIKGSTNDGQVFAENDGTGSVNGWGALTSAVSSNTSKLATIAQGAEVNVQANWTQTNTSADDYIKNKPANLVQDANYVHTDNNFTTTLKNKLDGIESGAEVNAQADWSQTDTTADDYIKNKPTIPTVNNATLTIQKNGTNVQTFTANSSTNKTANITVPTAVSELTNDASYATTTQLNNGLATKQDTLTAGNNIQINGNTISATDTTYTAGNAIDITNGEISADIHPADFFTAEDTVSDCGSDLGLDDTMASTLRSVELKGDTYQQTYSGFQLLQKQGLATPTTDTDFWYSVSNQTITALEDGWARFTSSDSSASKNFFFNRVGGFSWEVSTTYTVICEIKNAPSAGRLTLAQPQNASDPFASVSVGVQADYAFDGTDHTFVFSGTTKANHVSMGLRPFFNAAFASGSSVDLRLTIVAGDHTADYQNYIGDNWEPYVGGIPAPNPDYPQNIQVVTGEQNVWVHGKNLIDNNDLTFDHCNVSPSLIHLSTLPTGIRFNTTYHSTTGSPALMFKTPIDLTKYAGKTIRMRATFGAKGEISISRTNDDLSIRTSMVYTDVSGQTISWTVPEDVSDAKWLCYRFRIIYPGNEDYTVDFTDLIMTIDEEDMSYAPYQSQSYTINLGSTELCKIGDYQDYIYKSGDDWYAHKAIAKYTFTGTETWSTSPYGTNTWRLNGVIYFPFDTNELQIISNIFTGIKHIDRNTTESNVIYSANSSEVNIRNTSFTSLAEVQAATNGNYVYYALATPTDTKITDATLVGQLNALAKAKSYNDQTNIIVTATGDNLPATLCVEAYRKSLSGVIEAIDNACTCGERATHLVLSNPTTATWGETGSIAIPLSDGSAVVMGTSVSTDVVFTKDDGTTMTVGDLYTALTNGESFEIDLPFGEINSACARDSAAIVATVENVKLDGSSKQTLDQTSQGNLFETYTSSVPVAVLLSNPWGRMLLDERFGVEHLTIDDNGTMTSSYRFVVNTYENFQPPR